MIGGKPNRSVDRAPQSAASRDRKGSPAGSMREAALARLGRARSTRRPPPWPPRPARSWPERRSRGPQPAAVRAPPRVPRLACQSAVWRPPPARHDVGPVRTPPPSHARTRAVRHSRARCLCRWLGCGCTDSSGGAGGRRGRAPSDAPVAGVPHACHQGHHRRHPTSAALAPRVCLRTPTAHWSHVSGKGFDESFLISR